MIKVFAARNMIMQTIHHDALQLEFECVKTDCNATEEDGCSKCHEETFENMAKLMELYKRCMNMDSHDEIELKGVKITREEQW